MTPFWMNLAGGVAGGLLALILLQVISLESVRMGRALRRVRALRFSARQNVLGMIEARARRRLGIQVAWPDLVLHLEADDVEGALRAHDYLICPTCGERRRLPLVGGPMCDRCDNKPPNNGERTTPCDDSNSQRMPPQG